MSDSSLVLYSNTGRRLMFDEREVVMPVERFLSLKHKEGGVDDDDDGAEVSNTATTSTSVVDAPAEGTHQVSQWFVKQWEAMKGFYMTRIWKDDSLQKLSLEEFTNRIADAVIRRWEHHKEKQREAKRRKRQQAEKEAAKRSARQVARDAAQHALLNPKSNIIILTNFIILEDFAALSLMARGSLLEQVGALIVSRYGAASITGSDIMADESAPAPMVAGEPATSKGARTEEGVTASTSNTILDDRLAVRVAFAKPEVAATAVMDLNGFVFPLTNRPLLCELMPTAVLAGVNATGDGAKKDEKSFMDQMDEEIAAMEAEEEEEERQQKAAVEREKNQ